MKQNPFAPEQPGLHRVPGQHEPQMIHRQTANAHSTWRHTLRELEQEWPGITRKYFRKNSLCSNSLEPTSKLALNFWCSCLGLQSTGIMGVGYLPYLANSILICLKFFIIKKEANSISLQRASHATQPTELFLIFKLASPACSFPSFLTTNAKNLNFKKN